MLQKLRKWLTKCNIAKFAGVLVLLIGTVMIIYSFFVYRPNDIRSDRSNIWLKNGWEYYDQQDKSWKSMSDQSSDQYTKSDRMKFRYFLPESNIHYAAISFLSFYQKIEIYVEGQLIYETPTYKTKKYLNAPVSMWNFAELPFDCGGKEMELIIETPYHNYMGDIPEMRFGKYDCLQMESIQSNILRYIDDIILSFIGIILLVITRLFKKNRYSFMSCKYLGLLGISAAVWFRTGTVNIPLHIISYYTGMMISYISFMLIPICFLMFLKYYNRIENRWMDFLIGSFLLNDLVVLCLHIIGVVDLVETIFTTHILIVISIIIFIYLIYNDVRERHRKIYYGSIFVSGIFIVCTITEILNYYLKGEKGVGTYARGATIIFLIYLGFRITIEYEKNERGVLLKRNEQQKALTQLMVSQIRPHFVFNTLGAVRIMIHTNPDIAYEMIYNFSKCLRASLNAIEKDEMIPFSDELAYIKAYVNIENVRFSNKIHMYYEIEDDHFMILQLTIQPLVENAIRHGLRKGRDEGSIWVKTYKKENGHVIEVMDDGVGLKVNDSISKEENQNQLGIQNIMQRITCINGADIKIQSEERKGTIIKIFYPDLTDGEKKNENNFSR